MTTITLRNIPLGLQKVIEQRAQTAGLSFSRTVIRMLEEAAGQNATPTLHHDLDHLAGTWTAEEAAGFDAALAAQRKVDPEIWG
ncbi:MAG TPA: hypothetical protein DD490_21580 [Acidobacteria bacterium]|nr:hypothetical protein [Acidobacteriota bacterium]